MTHIAIAGIRYTIQPEQHNAVSVTAHADANMRLLSRVLLPPEAVPVAHAALAEALGEAAVVDDDAIEQERAETIAKIAALEATIAEHENANRLLVERVRELEAERDATGPAGVTTGPAAEVVSIDAAKESKPEKTTTKRRSSPTTTK